MYVYRNYYYSGAISVTLTPSSGTATAGSDFSARPVTLSWADGDANYKTAQLDILSDNRGEPAETFTIELSNPTGGAVLGPRSSTTVSIAATRDRQSSGGGALGYLSLCLLGALKFLISIREGFRPRQAGRGWAKKDGGRGHRPNTKQSA